MTMECGFQTTHVKAVTEVCWQTQLTLGAAHVDYSIALAIRTLLLRGTDRPAINSNSILRAAIINLRSATTAIVGICAGSAPNLLVSDLVRPKGNGCSPATRSVKCGSFARTRKCATNPFARLIGALDFGNELRFSAWLSLLCLRIYLFFDTANSGGDIA
jgi:hypothetical protein